MGYLHFPCLKSGEVRHSLIFGQDREKSCINQSIMTNSRPRVISKNLFLTRTVLFSLLTYFLLEVQPTLNSYFESGVWSPYNTRAVLKAITYSIITLILRYTSQQPAHTPNGLPGRNPIVVSSPPGCPSPDEQTGIQG